MLLALLLLLASLLPGMTPAHAADDTTFDFGRALRGTVITHAFLLRNDGPDSVQLHRLVTTPPLAVLAAPRELAPGETGPVRVRLDTQDLSGPFDGQVLVEWSEPGRPPAVLTLTGQVFAPIEIAPLPAFFVSAVRGEVKTAALEIINHEPDALAILQVEHDPGRFTTALQTLAPGRRYRLSLTLRGDGPAGKRRDIITLHTGSAKHPTLRVLANTYVRERVHTFPGAVDFGALPLRALRADPTFAEKTAQTLMVYQARGTGFRVDMTSDSPAVRARGERGPQGDRVQVTIQLVPEHLLVGDVRAAITLRTNDPEFPLLVVPVTARIVDR